MNLGLLLEFVHKKLDVLANLAKIRRHVLKQQKYNLKLSILKKMFRKTDFGIKFIVQFTEYHALTVYSHPIVIDSN